MAADDTTGAALADASGPMPLLNRRTGAAATAVAVEVRPVEPSRTAAEPSTVSAPAAGRSRRKGGHRRRGGGDDDDEATPFLGDPAAAPADGPPAEEPSTPTSSDGREFDPSDLEGLRRRLERVTDLDPRIDYTPPTERIPPWVGRLADLKYLTSAPPRTRATGESVWRAVVGLLEGDLKACEELLQAIQGGAEAGPWDHASTHFEDEAGMAARAAALASGRRLPNKGPPPFWCSAGSAASSVAVLRDQVASWLATLKTLPECGYPSLNGLDGTQYTALPPAVDASRGAVLQRAIMADAVKASNSAHWLQAQPGGVPTFLRVENALSKIPILHKDFLVDDDGPRMHLDVLNFADMLSPPIARDHVGDIRRTITVNINYVRLREHDKFTPEHRHASELFDAYERYRLLASNRMPHLKSRRFYEGLLRSIEHEDPPHPYLNELRDLHERTCAIEGTCMRAMLKAWQGMTRAREESGNKYVKLQFGLLRHGDPEAVAATPQGIAHDEILDYTPVLSELEASAGGGGSGNGNGAAAAAGTFSVALYAQMTPSKPPQLIGTTDRRPLNTAFTAIFNEAFDLMNNTDPAKITALLVDSKGAAIATVDIPHSLTSSQLLETFTTTLPLHSQTVAGEKRVVTGVMSLSTTWTTVAGLSIEDLERSFLRGDLDPLDPRHEAAVRVLGKYYQEQSAASDHKAPRTGPFSRRGASPPRGRSLPDLSTTLLAAAGTDNGDDSSRILSIPPVAALDARQQALRRRWIVLHGMDTAADAVEAQMLTAQIPADAGATTRLFRELRRERERVEAAAALEAVTGKKLQAPGDGLRSWQEKIRNLKLTQARAKPLKDHELQEKVLILPTIPTPKRLINRLLRALVPRSPLNPAREERLDRAEVHAALIKHAERTSIIIHVLKVADLPSRDDGAASTVEALDPFIVASFVGSEAQTRIESGCSPAFFQTMTLDFKPDDLEEGTLALIDDDVCISIYDRVSVTLPPATVAQASRAAVTHFRVERRLLGTVKIPFYTLFESPTASVEGSFDINVPRWVMGYKPVVRRPSIHLYVSLWPPLTKKPDDALTSAEISTRLSALPLAEETARLYQMAIKWRSASQSRAAAAMAANPLAKGREMEPFVNNSAGELTFICRYLSASGTIPPPGIDTVGAAIRFVSLMPFVVDMIAWNDASDVWSTCAEFLEMGAGDYEELAVLLAQLLRYIAPSEQTFLVLGTGSIFKQATFVLHTHGGSARLIEPRLGNVYDLDDPRSGLEEIAMVVSHDQVWANVQISGSPHRMVWALGDPRYWIPLIGEKEQSLVPSIVTVQRSELPWPPVRERQAEELEDHIRRLVKRALRSWRRDQQPTFQQRVGTVLREVLVGLEHERVQHANYHQESVTAEHIRAMAELGAQYEPVGVPVNVGFVDRDMQGLLDLLYETCVHEIGTDSVVYALAVYVKPYTANTVSVWAYLVGLVPRDPRSRL